MSCYVMLKQPWKTNHFWKSTYTYSIPFIYEISSLSVKIYAIYVL